MAAIYFNENFPKRVVEELRRLGDDVLTSYEAGQANQKNPDGEAWPMPPENKRKASRIPKT